MLRRERERLLRAALRIHWHYFLGASGRSEEGGVGGEAVAGTRFADLVMLLLIHIVLGFVRALIGVVPILERPTCLTVSFQRVEDRTASVYYMIDEVVDSSSPCMPHGPEETPPNIYFHLGD
jgi:hypothetical protein